MYNHMSLGASVQSRIPFGRWQPVGKLNGKFKMRLSNVTVLYALSGTTVLDKIKYGFFFWTKKICLFPVTCPKILGSVGRKNLFFILISL